MTNEQILESIAPLVRIAYEYEGDVTMDTTFDELDNESMKMIALTSSIENELDAEVTIHEIMGMKTIGVLVERIAEEM